MSSPAVSLMDSAVRAQLARCLRAHITWEGFWHWCEQSLDGGDADPVAARLALVIDGLIAAHVERGEWGREELLTELRRIARYIPFRDGTPLMGTSAYERYAKRRACRTRRHEAMGTIWRMRQSQYVLGATHDFPDRDATLPLTMEECGSLATHANHKGENVGRYAMGKKPTAYQNEILSRVYTSIATRRAANRHFAAVKFAIDARLPVPPAVLVSYPALLP